MKDYLTADSRYLWIVNESGLKEFYGAAGLNNLSKEHRKAETGFWLIQDYWSKGIMIETIPLICWYGFEKFGLHRMEAFVGRFISLDIYAKFR